MCISGKEPCNTGLHSRFQFKSSVRHARKARQKGPISPSLIYIQIREITFWFVSQVRTGLSEIIFVPPCKKANHLNFGPLGRMLFTSRETQCESKICVCISMCVTRNASWIFWMGAFEGERKTTRKKKMKLCEETTTQKLVIIERKRYRHKGSTFNKCLQK